MLNILDIIPYKCTSRVRNCVPGINSYLIFASLKDRDTRFFDITFFPHDIFETLHATLSAWARREVNYCSPRIWKSWITLLGDNRWGIILYLEYQSVFPFVRNGFPLPLSRKRVCPPRGGNTRLRVRGPGGGGVGGEPIQTTGEKAWLSVYSVVTTMVTSCHTKSRK